MQNMKSLDLCTMSPASCTGRLQPSKSKQKILANIFPSVFPYFYQYYMEGAAHFDSSLFVRTLLFVDVFFIF